MKPGTFLRLIVTLAVLSLVGCTPEKFDDPICWASPETGLEGKISTFASGYFPAEFAEASLYCGYPVDPVAIIGEIESEWYPRQWQAASEPSLYKVAQCKALPDFTLRFSYIPTFDPSVFIRVQSDRDGLKLVAKEMTGSGGYDAGRIGRSKEIRLSEGQASDLRKMLETEALFEEPPNDCRAGFDGSTWIFETVDKDGYRMVNRWSPREGAAHNLGKLLIELSGWRIETY